MKFCKVICPLFLFCLVSFIVYQSLRKENVYLHIEDIKGYYVEYSDTINHLKSTNISLKQTGKFWYQWWELALDTAKIVKINPEKLGEIVMHSQYFILYNFGGIGNKNHLLNKYKFHVILYNDNIPYIIPVKSIVYGME